MSMKETMLVSPGIILDMIELSKEKEMSDDAGEIYSDETCD